MSAQLIFWIRGVLLNFGSTLVFTTWMVYQAETLQLNAWQLILIGTTMEMAIFLFEIPTGIVADLYSRRLSIIIGFAVMGISFVLMGAIPTFAAALIAQVLWGIGYTFTSGATDAYAIDEFGHDQAEAVFLRGGQFNRAAALIAIPISVGLATLSLNLPILVGGAIWVFTAVFLIVFMPENGFSPTPREDRNTWNAFFDTFRQGLATIRTRPILGRVLAVSFVLGWFSEGWDRLWQAHLIQSVGLPALLPSVVWIGLITAADTLLGIGVIELIQRRLRLSAHLTRSITIMATLMVIGLVGYALAPSLLVALGFYFLFTLGRGLIEPLMSLWSNAQIPSEVRATVLSMQSQTDAIGQIIGGQPIGWVGQQSLRAALLTAAAMLSPSLWLLRTVPTVQAAPDESDSA